VEGEGAGGVGGGDCRGKKIGGPPSRTSAQQTPGRFREGRIRDSEAELMAVERGCWGRRGGRGGEKREWRGWGIEERGRLLERPNPSYARSMAEDWKPDYKPWKRREEAQSRDRGGGSFLGVVGGVLVGESSILGAGRYWFWGQFVKGKQSGAFSLDRDSLQ